MSANEIEEKMYMVAKQLIEHRYPKGWGGAAVIHTEDDRYLTSVAIDCANGGASLCIETGAICEAHKLNVKVTHCLCVVRENEKSQFLVLSPCGICQERLRYWGVDVKVGITTKDVSLQFVPLENLQPYHWTNAYPKDELEHFSN